MAVWSCEHCIYKRGDDGLVFIQEERKMDWDEWLFSEKLSLNSIHGYSPQQYQSFVMVFISSVCKKKNTPTTRMFLLERGRWTEMSGCSLISVKSYHWILFTDILRSNIHPLWWFSLVQYGYSLKRIHWILFRALLFYNYPIHPSIGEIFSLQKAFDNAQKLNLNQLSFK